MTFWFLITSAKLNTHTHTCILHSTDLVPAVVVNAGWMFRGLQQVLKGMWGRRCSSFPAWRTSSHQARITKGTCWLSGLLKLWMNRFIEFNTIRLEQQRFSCRFTGERSGTHFRHKLNYSCTLPVIHVVDAGRSVEVFRRRVWFCSWSCWFWSWMSWFCSWRVWDS